MSHTTQQLSSSRTMELLERCLREKDQNQVARSSALVEMLLEHDMTAWVKITKGRVYDFDYPNKTDGTARTSGEYRLFKDVVNGDEIDCLAFLGEEMAYWMEKLEKGFKSWNGTVQNFVKNVNARRYKLIEWDLAEQSAHVRATKARQSMPKPKSENAKKAQAELRKVKAGKKKHMKQMEKVEVELLGALIAKHATASAVDEFMDEYATCEIFDEGDWGTKRLADGSKWWTKNASDLDYVEKKKKEGEQIDQMNRDKYAELNRVKKMTSFFHKKMEQTRRPLWNASLTRRLPQSECPF